MYSGEEAKVQKDSAEVVIILQRGRLQVMSYTPTGHKTVSRGAVDVPVLGLHLQNYESAETDTVQIKKLNFMLTNSHNKNINPSTALSRIALVDHNNPSQIIAQLPDTESGTVLPTSNPILFEFLETNPFNIVGDQPDSVDILIDIPSNGSESDLKLTMESSSAIDAYDPNADSPIGIAGADGEEVAFLNIESTNSVLISKSFKESFVNYPNPFGSVSRSKTSTMFVYYLSKDSDLHLRIYTLTGDLVYTKSFSSGEVQSKAGEHDGDLPWDGRNGIGVPVVNGIYIAYLTATALNETAMTKVAVVR
jgi:hypothetical protein